MHLLALERQVKPLHSAHVKHRLACGCRTLAGCCSQSSCSTVELMQGTDLVFTSCTQGVCHLLMLPKLQVRAWGLLLRLGRGRQLLLRSLQDVGRRRRGRRLVPGVDRRGRGQLRVHWSGLLLLPQLLRRGGLPGQASVCCDPSLSCRA